MAKSDTLVRSVADLPLNNPNKYGRFDDDLSDLVDSIAGREPGKRHDPRGGFGISHTDAVDEDFMREAGNPSNKYGI